MKVYPVNCENGCTNHIKTYGLLKLIKCARSIEPLQYGDECPLTRGGN